MHYRVTIGEPHLHYPACRNLNDPARMRTDTVRLVTCPGCRRWLVRHIHDGAMVLQDIGTTLKRQGRQENARQSFAQAADAELVAASLEGEDRDNERAVLYHSAARLLLEAGHLRSAALIALAARTVCDQDAAGSFTAIYKQAMEALDVKPDAKLQLWSNDVDYYWARDIDHLAQLYTDFAGESYEDQTGGELAEDWYELADDHSFVYRCEDVADAPLIPPAIVTDEGRVWHIEATVGAWRTVAESGFFACSEC